MDIRVVLVVYYREEPGYTVCYIDEPLLMGMTAKSRQGILEQLAGIMVSGTIIRWVKINK